MPYINGNEKSRLAHIVAQIVMSDLRGPGNLNYLFTEIAKRYLVLYSEQYQTYNDIVGALESCKLELYRRKVGKYENLKIKENGDVF